MYKNHRRLCLIAIAAVYLLILVGGIVRTTGSGMGCPDWPRCFNLWVPPTRVEQLPPNYKQIYAQKRKAKNEKLAFFIEKIGFENLAHKLVNDESIYVEEDFNALKTWIEYLNRLLGAIIGLLIVGLAAHAVRFFWNKNKKLVWLSIASVFLVGFQGWIGSIVVSTKLLPFMISFHMLLAIVQVGLIIYLYQMCKPVSLRQGYNKNWVILAFGLTLIQIFMGAQLREQTDVLMTKVARTDIIDNFTVLFYIHRSFSLLILAIHLYIVFLAAKSKLKPSFDYAKYMLLVLLGGVFTGILLTYTGFPAYAQPVHLLTGTLLAGLQMYGFIGFTKETSESSPIN